MTARPHTTDRDRGFTLIELLVVLIILGVLAAIAIPVFLNQRKKAVDASIRADIRHVAEAAETYSVDHPYDVLFSDDGTQAVTKNNLTAAGMKVTGTNWIQIAGGPASGFCVRGWHAGGIATANHRDTAAFWYDSLAGGLKAGYAAGPPDGRCDDTDLDWATIS